MAEAVNIGWIDGVQGEGHVLILRGEESIVAEYGMSIRFGDTVVTSDKTSITINVSYSGESGTVALAALEMAVFDEPLFATIQPLFDNSSAIHPINIGSQPTYYVINLLFEAIPDAFSGHAYWPQVIGPNENIENKFPAPSAGGERFNPNAELVLADTHDRTNAETLPDDRAPNLSPDNNPLPDVRPSAFTVAQPELVVVPESTQNDPSGAVSYTHLTLPTTPYV